MHSEAPSAREILLQRLLDAYERSSSFGKPAPWPRDMIVRLDAKTFPAAFEADGREQLEALRAAGAWLVSAGAARCERAKGGLVGTAITALRLGTEEVARAYELARTLGYEPLPDVLEHLKRRLHALRAQAEGTFMLPYLTELETALEEADLSPLGMRAERLKREFDEVCDALLAACAIARGDAGWERMVSERLFRNTKRLATIRARVTRILLRADPRFADDAIDDDADVLAVYGMRRRPGFIVCSGTGLLETDGDRVRLEAFVPCAMLPEAWAPVWIQAVASSTAHTLTTIENEYAFYAYLEEAGGPAGLAARGELALYIAGFPARFLADALAQLACAAPHLTLRHWGDADVGGVRIWLYLRALIQRPLGLHRTTSAWLRSVDASTATPLTSLDRARLVGVRRAVQRQVEAGAEDAREVLALVDAMLELGIKVEQERM